LQTPTLTPVTMTPTSPFQNLSTPTQANSPTQVITVIVTDPTFTNGFWVVLVLLVVVSIALCWALVMLRKSRKVEVERVQ